MRISYWSSDVCSSDLLPVKFACGAGDGWRVLWAWLDRAGEEEQRLLGRFAEGQLLVTLGRPRPLVLDPVAHGRHVVGDAVVHERHDAQIPTRLAARTLGQQLEDRGILGRHVRGDRKSTRLNSSP